MTEKEQYLTQEKYDELQKELQDLKTTKRKEVAENLEYAKSLGDLSENAEYHEARAMQAELEDRINKIEAILRTAKIVSDSHSEKINIGAEVILEKESNKEKISYTVVGSEEADISKGKISSNSPLGSAIIGKKKGEKVIIQTPKGKISYTIVSVK
jgi:transcription elongation factor GreA